MKVLRCFPENLVDFIIDSCQHIRDKYVEKPSVLLPEGQSPASKSPDDELQEVIGSYEDELRAGKIAQQTGAVFLEEELRMRGIMYKIKWLFLGKKVMNQYPKIFFQDTLIQWTLKK